MRRGMTMSRNIPLASNIVVDVWAERDRLHIRARLADEIEVPDIYGYGKTHKIKTSGRTIAEWWDEDAVAMFEDGFFKPGIIHRQLDQIASPELVESVRKYLVNVGMVREE